VGVATELAHPKYCAPLRFRNATDRRSLPNPFARHCGRERFAQRRQVERQLDDTKDWRFDSPETGLAQGCSPGDGHVK
jgi:hypothetical protein